MNTELNENLDTPINLYMTAGVVAFKDKNTGEMSEAILQGILGTPVGAKRDVRFIEQVKNSIAMSFMQVMGDKVEDYEIITIVVNNFMDLGVMTAAEFYGEQENKADPTKH